jgi:enamine deaminase RidA (YjgF/YER057c/UK114 family)
MNRRLVALSLQAAITAGLALAPALVHAHDVPELKRIKSATANAPILAGVLVPGGSTLLYLSGQVPAAVDNKSPADSIDAYGDTKTQALGVFKKIAALLAEQGMTMADVVKLSVYLVGDPKLGNKLDFKGFSEAYAQFFGTAEQPNLVARTTVQVAALANPGFLVEIEATAVHSKSVAKPAPKGAPK